MKAVLIVTLALNLLFFGGCALAFSPMLDADTAWMILGGFGLAALNGWGIWVVARGLVAGGKDTNEG